MVRRLVVVRQCWKRFATELRSSALGGRAIFRRLLKRLSHDATFGESYAQGPNPGDDESWMRTFPFTTRCR